MPFHVSTLSNINISETCKLIAIKFYLKHQWGGRKDALGFWLDRIKTLVSMETDRSHRVIMGKACDHSSALIFDWISFILAGNEDDYKSSDEFEIQSDLRKDCGVSCPRAF